MMPLSFNIAFEAIPKAIASLKVKTRQLKCDENLTVFSFKWGALKTEYSTSSDYVKLKGMSILI